MTPSSGDIFLWWWVFHYVETIGFSVWLLSWGMNPTRKELLSLKMQSVPTCKTLPVFPSGASWKTTAYNTIGSRTVLKRAGKISAIMVCSHPQLSASTARMLPCTATCLWKPWGIPIGRVCARKLMGKAHTPSPQSDTSPRKTALHLHQPMFVNQLCKVKN